MTFQTPLPQKKLSAMPAPGEPPNRRLKKSGEDHRDKDILNSSEDSQRIIIAERRGNIKSIYNYLIVHSIDPESDKKECVGEIKEEVLFSGPFEVDRCRY